MRARILLVVVAILGLACSVRAAELKDKEFMDLWANGAPDSKGKDPADVPAVQVFLPAADRATGAATVVCPGGGYGHLAPHEGAKIGEWLASHGVTAFVLRYRLGPKYHHPVEMNDGLRAIRFVRAHAEQWKLDPKRIGIMGFSAGGHLASTVATHYTAGDEKAEDPIDRVSSRPDFQILVYPVITMGPGGHAGSRRNLLGEKPDPKLIESLSNEKQVTKDTPPAFVVHSTGDPGVPVANSDMYVEALKKAGVAVEYIRENIGGHGFGLTDKWEPQFLKWLVQNKVAAAPAETP